MTKDEALKLALEALENLFGIPDKWTGEGGGDVAVWRLGGSYRAQQAITAIKEALAQPEQKPVQTIPSFTQLQQIIKNLEHCLSRDSKQEFLRVWIRDWTEHKLSQNTTPPQRTWVGLTDEHKEGLICMTDPNPEPHHLRELIDVVEFQLKEKNGI